MNCYNINKHKLVNVHMSSSSRLGAGVWLAYGVALPSSSPPSLSRASSVEAQAGAEGSLTSGST